VSFVSRLEDSLLWGFDPFFVPSPPSTTFPRRGRRALARRYRPRTRAHAPAPACTNRMREAQTGRRGGGGGDPAPPPTPRTTLLHGPHRVLILPGPLAAREVEPPERGRRPARRGQKAPRAPQIEAFVRFFVGAHNVDMTYDDDAASIARKNLASVSGFWFDCATSIPWSFMDLRVYLVRPPRPAPPHPPTAVHC
jgi:hypothetical protein